MSNPLESGELTLGELRKALRHLQGLPDNFKVMVVSPEMDFERVRLFELDCLEGTTSDGPGTVVMTLSDKDGV